MTNRHEWPGNKHFHKCEHGRLTAEQQRKKKWLKPGSAAHTALFNIVKDKLLLKDIVHLVQFVHMTALEVYHSLYLKYLPKLTHFTHDVMKVGTMLAALDHNFNANRPQVRQIYDTIGMIPLYLIMINTGLARKLMIRKKTVLKTSVEQKRNSYKPSVLINNSCPILV